MSSAKGRGKGSPFSQHRRERRGKAVREAPKNDDQTGAEGKNFEQERKATEGKGMHYPPYPRQKGGEGRKSPTLLTGKLGALKKGGGTPPFEKGGKGGRSLPACLRGKKEEEPLFQALNGPGGRGPPENRQKKSPSEEGTQATL